MIGVAVLISLAALLAALYSMMRRHLDSTKFWRTAASTSASAPSGTRRARLSGGA